MNSELKKAYDALDEVQEAMLDIVRMGERGQVAAGANVIRAVEAKARLLGLNAPTKTAMLRVNADIDISQIGQGFERLGIEAPKVEDDEPGGN